MRLDHNGYSLLPFAAICTDVCNGYPNWLKADAVRYLKKGGANPFKLCFRRPTYTLTRRFYFPEDVEICSIAAICSQNDKSRKKAKDEIN
jgi:hypothetical protein